MADVSSQLERWQGRFGKDYTDRNQVDWYSRVETFRRLIPGGVRFVLEVGANRGHNLQAIHEAGVPFVEGVEPQSYARRIARRNRLRVHSGDIYTLPDTTYDLAFTCGVLEHVPSERLDEALTEMHRVASRYLLAIEYHADTDIPVVYRGHSDMLWKRDYGKHYQRLFPDLRLLDTGDLDENFDHARYWLLEKP